MRRLPLLALAAALACSTEVTPKNPYDPATPLPLQAKARVAGTVETGAGAPFAGLTVYLRQNGQLARAFTTDDAGAFVFDALTPGGYAVEAQAPGFAPLSIPLTLAAGADVDVGALAMTPLGGVDTGALRGVARLGKLAAAPGGPVEADPAADHGGILVEAVGTPYAAVTTSTGDYELSLPPGTHTLRVSKPSYVAQTLPDLQVALGTVTPVVVVILATNPAKVTGQVVAELPGGGTGPLADALVTLDGTSATGLTNAAGQFTLDQLAPGSYLLRVLKDGYVTASAPVLNLEGGEERVLADPLALTLERGAIRGQVRLADTPADASGVVVEVTGSGRAVVTGADGAFAFDALVAGTYEVRARKDGYGQQVATGLAVAAGAAVEVPLLTLVRQGGTVTISEGAVTRLTTVTLQLGAPAAAGFRVSEDPAFADPALGDVASAPARPYLGPGSSAAFTLSGADGLHAVYVSFVDGAGSASAPASASIVLDRAAPVAPSVVIGTGAPYVGDPAVGLSLSAQDQPAVAGAAVSGLDQMELADNVAFTGAVKVPYNLSYTLVLGGADGVKAVYARFIDRAGNVSDPAVALVTLDRVEPQSPAISLSGGAGAPPGTAPSPLVTAALSASDENEGTGKQNLQVRLSNAAGFAGATWQPYAATVSWLLPPGDGDRTVYAQFMDPAGNQSLVTQATIRVSSTAPTAGRLVIAGGAAATRLQVVPVALSATGATEMRLSVDGVPQAAGWIPYDTSATVDLGASAVEVSRSVSVAFRNGAGLEGGAASASIVLDQRAPTGTSVAVNGGAATTATLAVTLSLSALDAPAAAGGVSAGLDVVELSNDGFLTSSSSPMVSSLSWTLAAGADGPRTVSARFRDRAGNASAPVTATIAYDHTPPSGPAIALSGGATAQPGYTGSPVVTAALSATDANDGGAGKPNLQMRLSTDAGFAGVPWLPFAATTSFALPGGDGPKTVYAQFRDAAGNESLVASATITLAATPPSAGSVSLPAATSAQVVTASISATGADRMLISVNGVPQAAGWIPYAPTASVDLGASPDEATRGVSVLFRNAGGVEGAAAATSTVMDRTAPTVTAGSLRVNGGAAFTGSTAVSVALSASDGPVAGTAASGVAWVELSHDGTTWTQLPWAGSVPWTLSAAGGDGARTVWARVRDRAGNASSPAVSASIFLDRTGPTAAAPVLAGNATAKAGYTGTPVVAVTVSATDPSEGTGKADLQVQLGNDSGFSGSTWQPYAPQLAWILPVGDGPKTVWARFKDGVGNVSAPVSATINLMETPPSAGTIAVAGGAAVTNQVTVPVHVSAVNADRMLFYVNGVAQAAGWLAYAADATVDLGASPDETVRTVSVVFRNAGGVDGADALSSVVLDRTAPSVGSVVIGGGATFTGSIDVTLALSSSDGPATGTVAAGLDTVELSNDGFATFASRPYATSMAWRLATGLPDGARTVSARFRDKAGNASTPAATDAINVDTAGPTAPAISLAGNASADAGYTGTPVVTATLSATDANEGAGKANLQVRVSNDSSFAGASWQAYVPSMTWVLSGGDGAKTVWAQFRDAAGNLSDPASAGINLLTAPPSGGSLVLDGGKAATSSATTQAVANATGAAWMQFSVNGQAVTGWLPFTTAATSVSLASAPDQAPATVTVSFRNRGGVEGGATSATIRSDHTAPFPGMLAITGTLGNGTTSNTFTATPAVTLTITPPGADEVEMAVAQTGATAPCSDAYATPLWQPVSRSASLVLSGADGDKRACVVFRDAAGNWAAASAAPADVRLDTTAPTNPTFTNLVSRTQNSASAPSSGLPIVTASTDATAGGVTYQCTGGTAPSYGASWVDCGTSTSLPRAFALAANTQSTLGVRARDAAYNYSPGTFVQIVHDDVRPMPPNVTSVLTTRDSLAIGWEASPDADVESYRVYYGNFAGDFSGTGAAQGPSPVAVTGTGQATQGFVLTGLTTSYPYYVAVEAVDRAGNASGPSGQRFAQPNDANPRLLSTYGGEQRAVGVRRYLAGGKAFAYVAQNQGIVQLDVTTEASLPGVTGRVSLPNFVPDAEAPLVVFDCSRTNRAGTVVAGHCVVVAGSTLEGDFRGDGDAYRAPAPVAFFPVNPGGAGTVMTVLPARPHRVVMASVGGRSVLLTVERSGVKAWDLANVKAPRLLASAALDLATVRVAGEAWGATGQALLVYAPVRTGTLPTCPPTLYEFGLANVWSGTLSAVDHGWLYDPWGNLMGWSVDPIVPVIGDMQFYVAWNDASGTWLGEWSPGGSTPWDWIHLSDPGAGDPDNRPIAAAAGNAHVYVFCDQPPAMSDPGSGPYAYQVFSDGGLGVTGAINDLTTTARSATVAVYPNTATAANDEHLLVVDQSAPGEYTVRRWASNNADHAIAYNANPFREVSPVWLAESDRYVFVSDSDKIFTLDAANPLDPRVVATYQDGGDVPSFAKLQVHGHYLYAFHTGGARNPGVYILKIRGDGSLEYTGHLSPGMGWSPTDFVVRGRWLYLAMGVIRVYDVSTPSAPAWWYVTATNPGCAAIDARPARVGGTTYEALLYCGNAGVGAAADTFQVWAFTGSATPTALSAAINLPNDVTYYHPRHVTVRGTTAAVSNVLGAHLVDVTNPAAPTVGGSPLAASGPVLFQGGYLVGLGKTGAASGPDFLRQQGGAEEGTILFSTCAVDDAGAGSLASASGVYYASCLRNGVSVFAASAPGGGSLLQRADVSLAWNTQTQALATDGVSAFLAGPEFPGELGRLYSADLRANPSGAPSAPAFTSGNLLPGGDAAFHLVAQDGVLHVFEGYYNNTSLLVRSMVPTPVDAAWPTRGSYTVPVVVGQSNGPWNAQPVSDGELAWASRKTYLETYDLRYATPSLKNQLSLGLTVSALALSRERLYAGLATSGQVRVYDTTSGTFGTAPIALNVTASSGSVTGITGLAAHGQYLFVTYRTSGVDPYGLAVYRLGANRDGSGATAVARFPSAVPLANPTVAGDVLYVTRDLGLATYDLTPLWQDAVPPVLAGATVSTEPATVQPRFIMDGPWGYLVGGTFRSFDLRQ